MVTNILDFNFESDAFDIFQLFCRQPNVFFLDSSLGQGVDSHYSFIGFSPFEVFASDDPQALDKLENKFAVYQTTKMKCDETPFPAGIMGCLAYDYGIHQEPMALDPKEDMLLPRCYFGFYDTVITIDHRKNKIFVTGVDESMIQAHQLESVRRKRQFIIHSIESHLKMCKPLTNILDDISFNGRVTTSAHYTRKEYYEAVQKALQYIGDGDIYQVNLAQRLCYHYQDDEIDPVVLYSLLRKSSPSSFTSYMDCEQFQIISSSPERFIQLQGNKVMTKPMKGTRPRSLQSELDQQYRQEIVDSVKDQAELLMITDLERNDMGKVCEFGSVQVTHPRTIEAYSTVYQATSTIEGQLRDDCNAFDLIKAGFPGGSITGCPKIRAMQIINELEPSQRSFYTGVLGYVSFHGDMDFNILIRTLLHKPPYVYCHVGSGIVADSLPEKEYQEVLVKSKAMQKSLNAIFNIHASVS